MATKRRVKASTETDSKQAITLKGSTKLVTEFFEYSLNSILYQRGIYPAEDFKFVKKYGLTLFATVDEKLEAYIQTVVKQLKTWIQSGNVSRLVMAIISKETRETLERWQFDLHVSDRPEGGGKENDTPAGESPKKAPEKEQTLEQVQKAVREIMKNITSSVAFLPMIDEKCVFNILVYTDNNTEVPTTWIDSDPHMITGQSEQVKLRSFSTNFHKVEAMVSYRYSEEV